MNSLILSLLIGLLMTIAKTTACPDFIMAKSIAPISVEGHTLTLLENGKIGGNNYTLVCKGVYDNEKVAVKLTLCEEEYEQEMKIYKLLNATDDPNIEKKAIPRVYCDGSFKIWTGHRVYFIAMSLFERTLQDRFCEQRRKISDMSLARIFLRSFEAVEYMHSVDVVHNEIKPENIFLRGAEAFIGDFDMAEYYYDGDYIHPQRKLKCYRDYENLKQKDRVSLIISIWEVAGYKPYDWYDRDTIDDYEYDRLELTICNNCKHFTDENILYAFKEICEDIFLYNDGEKYDEIRSKMLTAIEEVNAEEEQRQLRWLKGESPSEKQRKKEKFNRNFTSS